MTSEGPATAGYVWVWLPEMVHPVVVGRTDMTRGVTTFTYGRSYLELDGAIELFGLPLQRGPQQRDSGAMPLCIADAAPDGWGQRVIENRRVAGGDNPTFDFGVLDYLSASSGDDRVGGLDIRPSSDDTPGEGWAVVVTVDELAASAAKVEAGEPLSPELDRALIHGTSIGGARPKALLADGRRSLISKFASTSDPFPVVRGEFATMELARRVGLDVAGVELTRALGRDVLLVERFDRPGDGNILVGNTDDHARNHAAFWDGHMLTLTPAYDICPQVRTGGEAAQAMAIGSDGFRSSQLVGCVERCGAYGLTTTDARAIVEHQIDVIEAEWAEVADLARMSIVEREGFWHRQILNPYALEGFS